MITCLRIQDIFYVDDKVSMQMDSLRFVLLYQAILLLLTKRVLAIFVLVCTS